MHLPLPPGFYLLYFYCCGIATATVYGSMFNQHSIINNKDKDKGLPGYCATRDALLYNLLLLVLLSLLLFLSPRAQLLPLLPVR